MGRVICGFIFIGSKIFLELRNLVLNTSEFVWLQQARSLRRPHSPDYASLLGLPALGVGGTELMALAIGFCHLLRVSSGGLFT